MLTRRIPALAVLAAAALAAAGCSSSGTSSAGSQTTIVATSAGNGSPAAKPTASPSPCALSDTQDLIVRDDDPGASVIASEIGEVDLANCATALSEFQQTAGQGAGECTTIAWAKDNPGYDVNAIPAKPLQHVIASAGPGC